MTTGPGPGGTTTWPTYDVVIIGGGVHGLATAYYLAAQPRHHQRRRARQGLHRRRRFGPQHGHRPLELPHPRRGAPSTTGRSSSTSTSPAELNFNVMFSQRGHLTLAHNDSSLRTMRWRAEVNKIAGDRLRGHRARRDQEARPGHGHVGAAPGTRSWARCTTRRAGSSATTPSTGATPGRPTPSASRSTRRPRCTGIDVDGGRVAGVQTDRGPIAAPVVVNCTAGWAVADRGMVGVGAADHDPPAPGGGDRAGQGLPRHRGRLRARCTSTSARPTGASSSSAPASTPSPPTRCGRRSSSSRRWPATCSQLMPSIAKMRVLRQWAGLCDMTPDYSPIIGTTPVDGFLVDVGLGHLRLQGRARRRGRRWPNWWRRPGARLIAGFDLARFGDGPARRREGRGGRRPLRQ